MATFATTRKHIVAELGRAGQCQRLYFERSHEGDMEASTTCCLGPEYSSEVCWFAVRILVTGDTVRYELRASRVATRERLFAEINGKRLPRNAYRTIYPRFRTFAEATAAYKAALVVAPPAPVAAPARPCSWCGTPDPEGELVYRNPGGVCRAFYACQACSERMSPPEVS